jgi:hypothetical protein
MIDTETLDTYEEMLRNGELDAGSQLELVEQCRTMLKRIEDLKHRILWGDGDRDGWG